MSEPWTEVRNELYRQRDILVRCSQDDSFHMEPLERMRIQSFLERWESPARPTDVPTLMKQFCVSAFSYAPLRNNLLAPLAGGLPTRDNIAKALFLAFDQPAFLDDSHWLPEQLGALAAEIQEKCKLNLSSRQFKPRVIAVLLTGSKKLRAELTRGLQGFYDRISRVSLPAEMWDLVNAFSKSINQVGPALICDFFKEIGFVQYVKVDHHFGRQFPLLVEPIDNCKLSPKKSFILSQEIAMAVGLTPFHLDSILYLWGRYSGRLDKKGA